MNDNSIFNENKSDDARDLVKGQPVLRTWELNSDSSRYDHLIAAPPDEVLHQMWSGWAGIALIAGAMNLILFISMLCSRPVRNNTFNVYLMAIIFPDIVFSLCCGTTCLMNALYGKYWSHWMCNLQQFYFVFGLGASAWMNSVIAYQLHTMLCFSSYRRRFQPPTRQRVLMHAAVVYLYVCFLGTWGLIERPWFPFHSDAAIGLICTPLDRDKASSIVFWVVFLPLFVGIPISYVQWVCWDVYRRNLMPPAGKSRTLTVYFARLIIAFLLMWTPNFIMMFIFGQWLPPWAHWAGGTWCHLQPVVSAIMTLYKPDVLEALIELLTCRCIVKIKKQNLGDRRNSYSQTSFFQLIRRSSSSVPVFPSVNGHHRNDIDSEILSTERVMETTEIEMARNHDPSRMSIMTTEQADDAEARVIDDVLWPTTLSTFVKIHEQHGKITIHKKDTGARVEDDELWATSASTLSEGREQQGKPIKHEDDSDVSIFDEKMTPATSSSLYTICEPQGETSILEDDFEPRVADDQL